MNLKTYFQEKWSSYPRPIKWLLAALRQMPLSLAVAKLPLPYNFSLPFILSVRKTYRYLRHGGTRKELGKFYFKTASRTIFGYSMRQALEKTALLTIGAEFGLTEDLISAISFLLIFICIILDATE